MLLWGNRAIAEHLLVRMPLERALQKKKKRHFNVSVCLSYLFKPSLFLTTRPLSLTVPQRPPSGVKEGAVEVVMVTVVGVVVFGDDVLQVGVLPVQVAGLDGPREHCPVRPSQ